MNRNVTRKWAEARQVNYGGDDWGDEDENDGYGYDEPAYPPVAQQRRSFTNPQPLNTSHRLSFDRGQEQRVFSASAAHPQQDFPPSQNTSPPNPGFYSQQHSAQGGQSGAVIDPTGRSSTDSFRRDDPRPQSRESNTSGRQFPPRTASYDQPDFSDYSRSQPEPAREPADSSEPTGTSKIIFPADIYKRHAEEERKRSQESSRPSMDSISREASEYGTPKQSMDVDSSRRRQHTTLDTVAERRSEYLDGLNDTPVEPIPMSHPSQQHVAPNQIQNIDTNALDRFPSASSRYTDRPDPASASTLDSGFPSRDLSMTDPNSQSLARPSGLPFINRVSGFGSDLFPTATTGNSRDSVRQSDQAPPVPQKDADQTGLQHQPSHGYRSLVNDAFQSENQKANLSGPTEDSMHRSNTTSTSEISPIVGRPEEPVWDRALAGNARRANEPTSKPSNQTAEALTPPRRIGTTRRDSPSPARRPLSMETANLPEPQSAISMAEESPAVTQNTAMEAQLTRPGPAVLVHSRGSSGDSDSGREKSLRNQSSYMSQVSERSNQRSASEEWAQWTAAQREAHARHGIHGSNPATPAPDSSSMSFPPPQNNPFDKNMQSAGPTARNDTMKPPPATLGLPSQRPPVNRDESFRPSLPGGWQSSASIRPVAMPEPTAAQAPKPSFMSSMGRQENTESFPMATAPRSSNWRSEYTGIQAQAFAAASAAGDALAGIFNGPSLTSRGGDSDVSSITESDEGPANSRRDPTLITRDFGDFTAESARPRVPDSSAARDPASTEPETTDVSQVTPRARQSSFTTPSKATPLATAPPQLKKPGAESVRTESPTRESERWWSDEEEEEPTAPAPLRTSRMSTAEPMRPAITHSDSSVPDVDQLHSDIVKSLTPKSSSIPGATINEGGRVSPLRQESHQTSPPFAAAALAVSPARAVQEQNSWKPLSVPQSKATSFEAIEPPMLGKAQTQAESGAPDNSRQSSFAQSGGDWFSPIPSGLTALTVETNNGGTSEPQKPAPLPSTLFTSKDDLPNRSRDSPETMPSTDAGKSFATATPDTNAPLHAPEYTPPASAHGPVTPQGDENLSSDTTPSHYRVGGAVMKDLPNPITTANRTPERPSSSTRSQDRPSPITPRSVKSAQPSPMFDSSHSYPSDRVPVGQIVSMGSAQQRIRAYNDNRDAYAQPVGQLENWLSFMNTSEHADVFSGKTPSNTMHATPSHRHQQRESIGVPIGTKQMQEDGKRLLASASKYGSKAGVLGKGLFSKGKERFRTVSAGQKVPR